MRRLNKILVLAAITSMATIAAATTYGPPLDNGPYNADGVALVNGQVWQADFSSEPNWIADVHFLLGDDGTPGQSDIQYNDAGAFGFPGGHFVVGRRANVRTGTVVYKFTLPEGWVTAAGGTVTADTMFNGTPSTQGANLWFGIAETFVPSSGPAFSNLNNHADFDKQGYDAGDGDTFGLYNKPMTLPIPEDVSTFYVAASESPSYSSARFGVGSLTVNAVWKAGEPEPEPEPDRVDPPIDCGDYDGNIAVSRAVPAWSADFSRYSSFIGDVHHIAGYWSSTQTDGADIRWNSNPGYGFPGPHITVGPSADGKLGTVIYEIRVQDPGYVTAGGTITASAMFNGNPATQGANCWLGVSDVFIPSGPPHYNGFNTAAFTKTGFYDPENTTFGYYYDTLTLDVPVGVKQFYIAVADVGTSARFGIESLDVEVELTEDPDYGIPVFAWRTDQLLMTYEWNRSQENPTGHSGVVAAGGMFGDPNAVFFDTIPTLEPYLSAARRLGIDYFPLRMNTGRTTARWPANTWDRDPGNPADTWTRAVQSFVYAAQVADTLGLPLIVIDTERYAGNDDPDHPLVGTYLFNLNSEPDLSLAYQRGLEVGQAIKAHAPHVSVMLIPEYGTSCVHSSSLTEHRFRSGIMAAGVRTLVGLEMTYGYGGEANNNEVALRCGGVNTFYSDPDEYRDALLAHLEQVKTELRTRSEDPALWDELGGIAPAYWVLCTGTSREDKRSAWYTPELFAAQLEAYQQAGAALIWEYAPHFGWLQWYDTEVAQAGRVPYYEVAGDPSHPDYWASWRAELATHPFVDAYIAVLKARGTPDEPWSALATQPGDLDGDGYVDEVDVAVMGGEWLQEAATP